MYACAREEGRKRRPERERERERRMDDGNDDCWAATERLRLTDRGRGSERREREKERLERPGKRSIDRRSSLPPLPLLLLPLLPVSRFTRATSCVCVRVPLSLTRSLAPPLAVCRTRGFDDGCTAVDAIQGDRRHRSVRVREGSPAYGAVCPDLQLDYEGRPGEDAVGHNEQAGQRLEEQGTLEELDDTGINCVASQETRRERGKQVRAEGRSMRRIGWREREQRGKQ